MFAGSSRLLRPIIQKLSMSKTPSFNANAGASSKPAYYVIYGDVSNYSGDHPRMTHQSADSLRIQTPYQDFFLTSLKDWLARPRVSSHTSSSRALSLTDIPPYRPDHPLGRRVSLIPGGVLDVALDGIVNAANEGCLGGGGVDGAIHTAAGQLLRQECRTFDGCATGQARITKGYGTSSKSIIHAVGPMGENEKALSSAYASALTLARRWRLRSLGVCGISTGIFGYPLLNACDVAVRTVLDDLEAHPLPDADSAADPADVACGGDGHVLERVVFCAFTPDAHEGLREALDQHLGGGVGRAAA
eukprot:TRINITY_DN36229_c0_g1_i1.p1 TRINITY_DN36229_c0_g1~~TRINITY_DN36229_c0_g1_i1.p1  ORF type:complete len:303 (+),score=31.84 TRINITY_DN36229_c0_g1_i1:88-996(+)